MSNSLDPDQTGRFVGPDLDPNFLKKISADKLGDQKRVKTSFEFIKEPPVLSETALLFVFCLFDLILYVPSTIFQLNRDGSSWVEPVLS